MANALRSLSKYVYDHKLTDKTELKIETLGGIQNVKLTVENGKAVNIEANIGKPVIRYKFNTSKYKLERICRAKK